MSESKKHLSHDFLQDEEDVATARKPPGETQTQVTPEPTLVISLVFPLREGHELKYRAKKSGQTMVEYLRNLLKLDKHD